MKPTLATSPRRPRRPPFDEYFLGVAKAVAARSDCTRASVGAVIVDPGKRVVSTGYVGTAPGEPGCLSGYCPRGLLTREELPSGVPYDNCISFHAEINALLFSDRTRHQGGTIYVTREPCHWCYKAIKAAGILFAVYRDETSPTTGYGFTDMLSWRAVAGG